MGKDSDFQQNKADLREALVLWFASGHKYAEKQFYKVIDEQNKLIRRVDRDECFQIIRSKSRQLCADPNLGSVYQLWDTEIRQILSHAETVIIDSGPFEMTAIGDTPLDNDFSNRVYAVNRIPVDLGLAGTVDDKPMMLELLMEKLPPFYHDLRGRMASPEMWDILTCFFGRVVSEDTPSEEFVYWYGPGGDGKGTLTELFFRHLQETAMPLSHSSFESRFGAGLYGDKRFVRIDEVPPGNFFTDRVKEVTGGNSYINVERKGKDAVLSRSRLALMFNSNYSPSYDGTMAQKRRLRVVESLERRGAPRLAAELRKELDDSFAAFLGYCLINYDLHNKTIPENRTETLEVLTQDTLGPVDSWIKKNLAYSEGQYITNSQLCSMFEADGVKSFKIAAVRKNIARVFKADDRAPLESSIKWIDGKCERVWGNLTTRLNGYYESLPSIRDLT